MDSESGKFGEIIGNARYVPEAPKELKDDASARREIFL
jgi:hypothetical protein